MRARSIKPGICDNELLGAADPYCTLLFERLWMMADREGRLEDRPLRIKAQAFPYREGLDINGLLDWLAENGFIARYAVGGQRFIQVTKFAEHQRPHANEAASKIPPPPQAVTETAEASTTKVASEHNQGSKRFALNPSSLTPDSGLLTADTPRFAEREWRAIQSGYPEFTGSQSVWLLAERTCVAAIEAGEPWESIAAGVQRYAEFCRVADRIPKFVKSPDKWFAAKQWREEWQPPPSKAEKRLAGNVSAAEEFMRRTEVQ